MKEVEVTLEVKNTMEEVFEILKSKGFRLNKKAFVNDLYLCPNLQDLNHDNIQQKLSQSVILRYLKDSGVEYKKITYKNKTTADGIVVSETKINLNCEDLDKAELLFSHLGFQVLVRVKYDVYEFQKENLKFALQDVAGLGLLLECEGKENYDNMSVEELILKKKELSNEIKNIGLRLGNDFDIKKSDFLIRRRL